MTRTNKVSAWIENGIHLRVKLDYQIGYRRMVEYARYNQHRDAEGKVTWILIIQPWYNVKEMLTPSEVSNLLLSNDILSVTKAPR